MEDDGDAATTVAKWAAPAEDDFAVARLVSSTPPPPPVMPAMPMMHVNGSDTVVVVDAGPKAPLRPRAFRSPAPAPDYRDYRAGGGTGEALLRRHASVDFVSDDGASTSSYGAAGAMGDADAGGGSSSFPATATAAVGAAASTPPSPGLATSTTPTASGVVSSTSPRAPAVASLPPYQYYPAFVGGPNASGGASQLPPWAYPSPFWPMGFPNGPNGMMYPARPTLPALNGADVEGAALLWHVAAPRPMLHGAGATGLTDQRGITMGGGLPGGPVMLPRGAFLFPEGSMMMHGVTASGFPNGAIGAVCDFPGCGRVFERITNLRRHKKMHSGERPYACKQCDKTFSRSDNLRQHRLVHIKLDPDPPSPVPSSASSASASSSAPVSRSGAARSNDRRGAHTTK